MQEKLKQPVLLPWLIAILVFFISLIRVYDIALDKITPHSTYAPFIPWVVVPAYIYCFILVRKGSLRAQLVLLNFLFFFIYLSSLNIIGSIYTETTWPTFDILILIYGLLNGSLLILTLYVLVGTLKTIDIVHIKERFTKKPPRALTALFFFLAALVVAANFWMEFVYLYSSHKLDCNICLAGAAVLFPFYLFLLYMTVAVLLISNRPLGYVLGPGLLLFCGIGGVGILDSFRLNYLHLSGVLHGHRLGEILSRLYGLEYLSLPLLPGFVAIVLEYLFLKNLLLKQGSESGNL